MTSIEEVMINLNHLVASGKVLYLGASDTPAWVVSKANQYARDHGLAQFVVYQGRWSAEYRDFEREILPMCADEGMGIAPWGALGGGQFKSEAQRKADAGQGRKMSGAQRDSATRVAVVLERVAARKATSITAVALAYVLLKAPYVFPIVGGRKLEHLKGNIDALSVSLSPDDIAEIETATPNFDIGFPLTFIPRDPTKNFALTWGGEADYVVGGKPIQPRTAEK